MSELLRAEALVHRFPDGHEGLMRVDFRLDDGEFLVLAGRNGSGKTLLMRHFLGFATPSAGRALFRGRDVARCADQARRAIGYVFQDTDAQILGQTVRQDLAFGPSNLRLPREEIDTRVRDALTAARLSGLETRRPESLSGGEKRRLAIAGILAMKSECIILDEPFANLDLDSIMDLLALLADLKRAGTTLLVLTHELEKVIHLADRLVIMDRGAIAYDGTPQDPDPALYRPHGLVNPHAPPPWADTAGATGATVATVATGVAGAGGRA